MSITFLKKVLTSIQRVINENVSFLSQYKLHFTIFIIFITTKQRSINKTEYKNFVIVKK